MSDLLEGNFKITDKEILLVFSYNNGITAIYILKVYLSFRNTYFNIYRRHNDGGNLFGNNMGEEWGGQTGMATSCQW